MTFVNFNPFRITKAFATFEFGNEKDLPATTTPLLHLLHQHLAYSNN